MNFGRNDFRFVDDSTPLFFFFLFLAFSYLIFFLRCLLVFIRFQFSHLFFPNNFFLHLIIFLWLLFHLSDLYIITYLTQLICHLRKTYSIQLSSHFVVNYSMIFEFALNFKNRTMSQTSETTVFTSALN